MGTTYSSGRGGRAGEGCLYDCELPLRYGVFCFCWLYPCLVEETPIPRSLIHPRWFFEVELFITGR